MERQVKHTLYGRQCPSYQGCFEPSAPGRARRTLGSAAGALSMHYRRPPDESITIRNQL